ncbi:TetR/AcrR family transcriptional regulator [Acidimangrovimonas pyrenivorans]|uniref:TetR/AcrR family transcriptional regulator n=1 Tax=Acidimangrovimonas pyrenivorans TaxID=2030798 RepID=A0ABV7AEI3_9RHOB
MDAQAEETGNQPTARTGGRRGTAKREQILAGAREVFMERGFEAASIDEIARVSGVSKPTLYRHFPDKRHLYSAFFTRECDLYAAKLFPAELVQAGAADALDRIARFYLDRLSSAQAQSAFRVAVGDAQRFPELARAFYATGPARGARHLEPLLEAFVARGELEIDDIALAAAQFLELCKADLFYKQVFCMIDAPDPAEIDRVVAGAVTVFLRAYGPRAPR